uniref:RING-type domain-containing protein n=1 Tax=viral metagenome TaxID=1070528 RepID=A0A6C0J5N0_9ZZZZ
MPNFKINNVKLVTSWSFNLNKNQDCTICRNTLNSYSIHSKNDNIDIVTGTCGHSFHKECIEPWLKTQTKCPICSTTFIKILN